MTATAPQKTLQIARDIALPADIAGKKLAWLGTTGSGKSYGAMKLAEEMLASGMQIIVLDPVGVWYGLRIDRDGKKPSGFDIPVFGGLHGDLPLEPTAGALIADVIVDRNISAVIDISQMDSDAQQGRFATDFAARLFHRRKAQPGPTFLFLEECQEFIPQNPTGKESFTLHAFTRIAKIGRNFGLGVGMISQRPQEISKKTLNLSECVFAFQMNGKQERDAVREWLRSTGTEDVDANDLPKLEVGHAHVWSPRWLKISRIVHIARRRTYDASSTPDFSSGSSIAVKPLDAAAIDALRSSMAESVERIEAADPSKLKAKTVELERKIVQLERELEVARSTPAVDEGAIEAARQAEREDCMRIIEAARNAIPDILAAAVSLLEQPLIGAAAELGQPLAPMPARVAAQPLARDPIPARRPSPAGSETPNEGITGPEQRILDAIAWANLAGFDCPSNEIVAFAARYSPTSSSYSNPRGALKAKALIEYPAPGSVRLTDAGRAVARFPERRPTAQELQEQILSMLPGPEARILTVLLNNGLHSMRNDEVAQLAGYSATSSSYSNPRGALKSLGLVEYPSAGFVRPAPFLFLK